MRFHTTEQLGPTQSLTPEGYLLCQGVPIARTGEQLYASAELKDLEAGRDGIIKVIREESEVFRPETMASFEGKSVTIDHAFVDPDTWRELTVGTAQNVRRGLGQDSDLLLADLLITDATAIEQVRVKTDDNGYPLPGEQPLRQVSCGYDADYMQEGVGVAYQRNIIGNHVALVKRGRAGPRCSIQDGEISMPTAKKDEPTLLKRLFKALRSNDEEQIKQIMEDADEETPEEKAEREAKEKAKKTEDSLAKLQKTVDSLAVAVKSLVKTKDADKEETEEEKKKRMEDEALEEAEKVKTGDSMQDVLTRAEIILPGVTLPTTDAAPSAASVVAAKRHVLREAFKTTDGKGIVTPLIGSGTVDALSADAVNIVFTAASEIARTRNNASAGGMNSGVKTKDAGKVPTVAELNARNAEFWKNN